MKLKNIIYGSSYFLGLSSIMLLNNTYATNTTNEIYKDSTNITEKLNCNNFIIKKEIGQIEGCPTGKGNSYLGEKGYATFPLKITGLDQDLGISNYNSTIEVNNAIKTCQLTNNRQMGKTPSTKTVHQVLPPSSNEYIYSGCYDKCEKITDDEIEYEKVMKCSAGDLNASYVQKYKKQWVLPSGIKLKDKDYYISQAHCDASYLNEVHTTNNGFEACFANITSNYKFCQSKTQGNNQFVHLDKPNNCNETGTVVKNPSTDIGLKTKYYKDRVVEIEMGILETLNSKGNYWRDGVYDREIEIYLTEDDLKKMTSAKMVKTSFDDWFNVEVNGTNIFSGLFQDTPRLAICDKKTKENLTQKYDGNKEQLQKIFPRGGNRYIAYNNDCNYPITSYEGKNVIEQANTWHFIDGEMIVYNAENPITTAARKFLNQKNIYNAVELKNLLKVGKNVFKTRTIIAYGGDMYAKFKFNYNDY